MNLLLNFFQILEPRDDLLQVPQIPPAHDVSPAHSIEGSTASWQSDVMYQQPQQLPFGGGFPGSTSGGSLLSASPSGGCGIVMASENGMCDDGNGGGGPLIPTMLQQHLSTVSESNMEDTVASNGEENNANVYGHGGDIEQQFGFDLNKVSVGQEAENGDAAVSDQMDLMDSLADMYDKKPAGGDGIWY